MGKSWDDDKGGRDQWIAWMTEVMTEAMRVLKPGAHGLVWALPRTSHWTATALENAGFEVRDVVTHLFGTGFPKSMDISKAIDKAAGAEREQGALKFKGGTQLGVINDDAWKPKDVYESNPATDAAKQWQGWGTALKPASEKWILVTKPDTWLEVKKLLIENSQLIRKALCQLSNVRFVTETFTSSLSAWPMAEQPDSAQWIAELLTTLKSLEPSEMTDMFKSQEVASIFLNTVWLWNSILDVNYSNESMFTTEMKSSLTTELKTLSFLISLTIPENTTQEKTQQNGSQLNVSSALKVLNASVKKLADILILIAPEHAMNSAISGLTLAPKAQQNEHASLTGPLSEDIILVRKPCSEKTVAANVLKHGTGGINIDASRIGTEERTVPPTGTRIDQCEGRDPEKFAVWQAKQEPKQVTGRFPANLVLDEEAAAALDEQSGHLHGAGSKRGGGKAIQLGEGGLLGVGNHDGNGMRFGDSGGASRFFYVAKASKSDKGEGNTHPTVKSTALMTYLIKLITPPGGVVLDPFMGSGSTLVAAKELGHGYIGIEQDADYFKIAQGRLDCR